jgi:predicted CopG family antitoxin
MNKEISNKYYNYIQKQENSIVTANARKDLARKLLIRYHTLTSKLDNEFKKELMETPHTDEVYKKLFRLHMSGHSLSAFFKEFHNRTMKEDEYNYLLNASPKKIIKYAKKEPAIREAILQKYLGEKK